MLFVGRFTRNKRIGFLLEAFAHLIKSDPDFHLLMVGSGSQVYEKQVTDQVTFCQAITDLNKLAPLYIASDVFTFPGDVGLGPLQALCYDLPIITLESPTHMPEIIYLNQNNSLILPLSTTPKEYAQAIYNLFTTPDQLTQLRSGIWESINHLTIEQMAYNFISGVNDILDKSE